MTVTLNYQYNVVCDACGNTWRISIHRVAGTFTVASCQKCGGHKLTLLKMGTCEPRPTHG